MSDEKTPSNPSPQPSPQGEREPRPARFGLTSLLLAAVVGGALVGGAWFVLRAASAPTVTTATPDAAPAPLYICPMHPAVTADHPSKCPLCGMKLEKVEPTVGSPAQPKAAAPPLYQCPMHPTITADHPSNCPICGMKLVKVEPQGGRADADGGQVVKGLATVTIDAARQQLIGLRTAKVKKGAVGETWRTVGRVEVDPTRVRKTNLKVEGYVERVFVDFVGRPVRKGEPLFSLYSPSLLSAQNEYLLALSTRDALAKGGGAMVGNGEALVKSARRKLELWDVPQSEIERLERTGEPTKTLTFVSPISGVVTAKKVVEGARIAPGDAPYEITDLSMVWVMADAYESDLSRVKVGMPATLTMSSYPNRPFVGEVSFIDPLLDPVSRTVKVHLHFPNPGGELKPEMFGEVVLEGVTHEGLRVPADAVVHSGTRDVVFLALGDGRFMPREVKLGSKMDPDIEVQAGLEEGDEVVTRANFLIDSESQLRSSLSAIEGK